MGILDAPARLSKIGSVQIDVSSHAATISGAEAAFDRIVFTGALAADATFQLPSQFSAQKIENATTGSFSLFVKRGSGGNPVYVAPGEVIEVA